MPVGRGSGVNSVGVEGWKNLPGKFSQVQPFEDLR